MKKLTSFAIGIIIIWPLLKAITWFIDNVLESALGRGLASDYTSVGLIILWLCNMFRTKRLHLHLQFDYLCS